METVSHSSLNGHGYDAHDGNTGNKDAAPHKDPNPVDFFGMSRRAIAFDPFASAEVLVESGVRKVDLEELLATADFVSLHCPLNKQTRGLIGADQLGLMKPNAYLLNLARGGIVEEDALYDALANHRIAGAALDCFENEPVITPHRLGELDNVLLAPHSIAWTDELFRDIGRTACQALLDLSLGRHPSGTVNPEVFGRPSFQKKWESVRTGQLKLQSK